MKIPSIQGYSQREVGAFLSVPVATVKNRLRAARSKIKQRMMEMVKKTLQDKAPSRSGRLAERVMEILKTLVGNAPVALSSDASVVAYGVRSSGNKPVATHSGFLENGVPEYVGGAEIWITDIESKETRFLTRGWGSSWCPRWSPDGQRLAFYSDRNGQPQVWVWERKTDTFRAVCEDPICVLLGFEGVHWLPDGAHLVAKLRAPGWHPPPDREASEDAPRDVWISPQPDTPETETAEGWHAYDACRGDVAVIDLATGEARRLGTELFPFGVAVSPDGQYAAAMCFSAWPEKPAGALVRYDLHLFALDGSRHEVLAERIPGRSGTFFSWSPEGDAIAYTTYGEGPSQLVLVTPEGRQEVIDGGEIDLGNREGYPPLWPPDGGTVYCWTYSGEVYAVSRKTGEIRHLTEGLDRYVYGIVHPIQGGTVNDFGRPGSLAVMTRDFKTMREGLCRIGEGEPVALVPEQNRSLVRFLLYGDTRGDWMVGQIEDATSPPDLFGINIITGEERRLTALNPGVDAVPKGPRQLISYQGLEGKTRRAALFLPPNHAPGKRHPTVIQVSDSGNQSGFMNAYGLQNFAWLTGYGYAVLLPDMPRAGSTGPLESIATLATIAADAVVEQGYADPERMGIIGLGGGGYAACCVITCTDRFRAAVVTSPFTDLVAYSLSVRSNHLVGRPWIEGSLLKDILLWDDPQKYIENSPVFHLDRVRTPLLLLHGTADRGIPISQSEETYAGLLRLGKTATLVRYHGEGRDPREWSSENREDYFVRTVEWFGRYLAEGAKMQRERG